MAAQFFISCASDEFRELREKLRHHLSAARCHVLTQEDFSQDPVGLLEKLDGYIRDCDVVIHIIGHSPGSIAHPTAVQRYLTEAFLASTPALRTQLGDFSTLTYTHWEGLMALHHQRRLHLYHLDGGQPEHLHRLRLALPQRHGSAFEDETDLLGKLIGDLRDLIPPPPAVQANNLPATIGDHFRGRDGTLLELHHRLRGTSTSRRLPLAIHGLGGIGKTRLAIEYGHRHASDYAARLLVSADTPQNLERQLAALTAPSLLDLPAHQSSEEAVRTAAVLRWLREHEDWLLIMDNVDTASAARAVEGLLPHLERGHVLITSRLSDFASTVATYDLHLLPDEDAVEFLTLRTGTRRFKTSADDADAATLARRLDGLALALEQAAAYIAEKRLSFARYLQHYETRRTEVLHWHHAQKMQYPASVAITWLASFEQLGDAARHLLDTLSFLAPEPIPRAMLEHAADLPLDEALVELSDYSLVRFLDDPPETFSMHRLVQEIVRDRATFATPSSQLGLRAVSLIAQWAPKNGHNAPAWPQWHLIAPHCKHLLELAEAWGDPGPCAPLLALYASYLQHPDGAYVAAELLYRRALAAREVQLGPGHPDTLSSVADLADLLTNQGNYTDAEPLSLRARHARQQLLGAEHPDTLTSINNHAQLLFGKGEFTDALPLLRETLAVRERILGIDALETLETVSDLGMVLRALEENQDALPLLHRALAGNEKLLGPEHLATLTSLSNLALLLEDEGNYDDAEPLRLRELEASRRLLGPEHPETLTSLNNLGHLLHCKGDLPGAFKYYEKTLHLREQMLGPDNPDTLISLNNLAALYRDQNNYEAAEPLYQRATETAERVLGADHPHTRHFRKNWDLCKSQLEG